MPSHSHGGELTPALDAAQTGRDVFDCVPVALAMVNLDGSLLRVNRAFIDEIDGLDIGALRHGDVDGTPSGDMSRFFPSWAQLLNGESDELAERRRFTTPDGSATWLRLRARLLDGAALIVIEPAMDTPDSGRSAVHGTTATDDEAAAARTLAALGELLSVTRASTNPDDVIDALGRAVIDSGEFRSLMIAVVDEDGRRVAIDRDFLRDADGSVVRGDAKDRAVTYLLGEADPVAEAARTGRMVVTVGRDPRLGSRDQAAMAGYPDDKVAYFIPVTRDDRTLAVLATASTRDEQDATMRRIESMGSLLEHAGEALDQAHVYRAVAQQREELRAVVAGARCLLWQSQVAVTPAGPNGAARLQWDVRISDEEAAQRFLPLDTSDGRAYIEAWDDAVGPDETARVADVARRAILAGEPSYEVQCRCTDATGARRWINEQVFVRQTDEGRRQCVGVCSDITPWKAAEEAVRDSEARFRRVFAQGPLGMAIVGPDFRLVDANDMLCGMLGYTREELRRMRFADFTHPDDIATDVELIRQVFAGEIPRYTVEKRYLRKDGALLWGRLTGAAVSGTPSETTHWLNMIEDVTDRRRAEGELRDMHAQLEQRIEERTAELEDQLAERIRVEGALRTTERERSRLMQDVLSAQEAERTRIARELHDQTGQALSSLLMGLRVVEGASSLATVKRQASQLREVTAQALDGVRTLAFDMRPTSLENHGLSAGVERDAGALGSQLGIAVDVHADGRVDGVLPRDAETALYRVIRAALTNIAHHASATAVSILLRRRESLVTALVEDDGVGFDVDRTLSGPIEGRFGLLAMVERVRPFDGVVSFESTRGAGATVYVQMPVGQTSDAPDEKPA